jgi:hypothetical protein
MDRVVRRRLFAGLLAVVVWNAAFDLQTRWAGKQFVAAQLDRVSRGQPVQLIEDAFQPLVRRAALISTLGAGLAVMGLWLIARRRTPR